MADQGKSDAISEQNESIMDSGKSNSESETESKLSDRATKVISDLVESELKMQIPFPFTNAEGLIFLFGSTVSKVSNLEISMAEVKEELKNINKKLDVTNKKLDVTNKKLDVTNNSLGETTARLDDLATKVDFKEMETRIMNVIDEKIEYSLNRQRIWLIGSLVVMTGLIISAIGIL